MNNTSQATVDRESLRKADFRARQEALAVDQSFCVTAPAGSGKTELLTQRVLKLLSVVDRPEQILAMTFTRKAAAEMHTRIIQALQLGELEEAPLEDYRRATWQMAKEALHRDAKLGWQLKLNPGRLKVQTIDSFCQRLASDAPIMSGLGVKFAITTDTDLLYEQAVDAMLSQSVANAELRHSIASLLLQLDNNVGQLRDLVSSLLSRREQWIGHVTNFDDGIETRERFQLMLEHWVAEEIEKCRQQLLSYEAELCEVAQFAANNLQADSESGSTGIAGLVDLQSLPGAQPQAWYAWRGLLQLLLTASGTPRKRLTAKEGFPAKKSSKDKQNEALNAEMKQKAQRLLNEMAQDRTLVERLSLARVLPFDGYPAWNWEILSHLCRCLVQAYAHLRLVFGQRGECDHTEIALAALDALGEANLSSGAAQRWDSHLQHILIDEFQDTSVTQFELIKRLTTDWQQQNLSAECAAKTLFVVGDGMQSIYGFRAAKVGLFLKARTMGIGDMPLTPIDLQQNFRSVNSVVEWNNQTFASAFPDIEDIASGAVRYHPSVAFKDGDDSLTHGVKLLASVEQAGRSLETSQLLDRVQRIQQQNSDDSIAILVRYRSHLAEVIPALDRAGIAWRGVEIDSLATRTAVVDCLQLTKALLNPADTLAWAAFFRSACCGLTLHDMQCLADWTPGNSHLFPSSTSQRDMDESTAAVDANDRVHQSGNLADIIQLILIDSGSSIETISGAIGMSASGAKRFAVIAKKIRRIWSERGVKPLRQWLEGAWHLVMGDVVAIYDELPLEYARDASAQRFADLSVARFFDLVEKLEIEPASQGIGFSLRQLEEKVERLFVQNTAEQLGSQSPVVQVMTIHKSKGLEFDHVLVPGLDRQAPSDDSQLLYWRERVFSDGESTGLLFGPIARPGQLAKGEKNPVYEFLREEEKRAAKLESLRLLYVAATRAKKSFIGFAKLSEDSKGAYKPPNSSSLLAGIWLACEEQFEVQIENIQASIAQDKPAPSRLLRRFKEDILLLDNSPSLPSQSVEQKITGHSETLSTSELHQVAILPEHDRLVGTCAHQILEHLVPISTSTVDFFEQAKSWLLQQGHAFENVEYSAQRVNRAIKTMLADETGRWILARHAGDKREWALSVLDETTGAIQKMVIDRSFVEKGERWIIDYKVSEAVENCYEGGNAGSDEINTRTDKLQHFFCIQREKYLPQLSAYRDAVSRLEKLPIRTALYFPLLGEMLEIDT